MVTFTHDDAGTPEQRWNRDWRGDARLTVEALFDGRMPERMLVVAAHPDDETLGAAGLVRRLAHAGVATDIIVATNGEASHPNSPTHTQVQLADVRRRELLEAVELLAPSALTHFLGLPDGKLNAEELAAQLRRIAADGGRPGERTLLVAPWRGDGHGDHEAAGNAAALLAAELNLPLLEYPVWLWHWATPDSPEVPWEQLQVLDLGRDEQKLKQSALLMHASQTAPLSDAPGDEALLGPAFLEHFARGFETFIPTLPAGVFERLHAAANDPWGLQDRFYERRKRSVALALLPRERFAAALELGCSIGVLSAELAGRSDSLLALDISPTAVASAQQRLNGFPAASARVASVPQDWPTGEFDLIVISEVGYFLTRTQLLDVVAQTVESLAPDGVVLLCHWRHPVDGWELDGDTVHELFSGSSSLTLFAEHREEDFRIDLLVRPPAVSVARATGVL
ncbi:bifunctional PIG-L family deacetylase/class I SAM-dependent methyltransferase [Arthrobacter sp. H20]|uniref:bifunctional PIG-L family deacetylase/class I SAM-dependent methyltransferase n=1 Tax=Arthrobacter sp. H20 TaxID=1267981 RepID=UPI00047987AD|nr:bifunctional PIG-L family deacetylase/class I SAM-dependent methyltransferase [Arthrobacter sp. H20]